jgi:hypothetical protein
MWEIDGTERAVARCDGAVFMTSLLQLKAKVKLGNSAGKTDG